MYIWLCVLCRMGQPLGSSKALSGFFLSIDFQLNHTYPTTQNEENNPLHRQERKKHQEKSLEKSRAAVIKTSK